MYDDGRWNFRLGVLLSEDDPLLFDWFVSGSMMWASEVSLPLDETEDPLTISGVWTSLMTILLATPVPLSHEVSSRISVS